MTFVYTLEDIIGLIALGVGVVGFLLIIILHEYWIRCRTDVKSAKNA